MQIINYWSLKCYIKRQQWGLAIFWTFIEKLSKHFEQSILFPYSSPFTLPQPSLVKKKKKFRLNLSTGVWQSDTGGTSSQAICCLQFSYLSRLRLSWHQQQSFPAGRVSNPCWRHFLLYCHSTVREIGLSHCNQLVLFLSRLLSPRGREACKAATKRPVCSGLTNSLVVFKCPFSLSILLSSVNFDGIFPQFQKLEKLIFRPLLQGHQGSGFLFQILIYGKNDLSSLLCFLVSRVFEEPL